jgi:hypothetical protein
MKFFRSEKPTLGSDKNGGLVLTDYEPLLYYHCEKFNPDLTFSSSKANIFKL